MGIKLGGIKDYLRQQRETLEGFSSTNKVLGYWVISGVSTGTIFVLIIY